MQDLTVTLLQADLHWEDIDANLAMFEEMLWSDNANGDVIILPEMFTTGFSMEAAALGEPMNSKTFRWMKQQAAQTNALVMGSYIVREGTDYYNRLIAMQPDGQFQQYDKRHLFGLAGEDGPYTAGTERVMVTWKGWKIFPMICYDLRFPTWARNRILGDDSLEYDLLVYVANWPAPRVNAWDTLLQARAIENLSYSVGVNRIGGDGVGVSYLGHSAVYDFKGETLFFNEGAAIKSTVTLEHAPLAAFRKRYPFHRDADAFEIKDEVGIK